MVNETSTVLIPIILGIILLFIGIFMLSMIEPMFSGMVYACSNSTTSSTPVTQPMNASLNMTRNMTFTAPTLATQNNVLYPDASCILTLNVTNYTNIYSGATLYVRNAANNNALMYTLAYQPSVSTTMLTFTGLKAKDGGGNMVINITTYDVGPIGANPDNYTIGSGTQVLCCSSYTTQQTVAGQVYTPLTTTIGVIFTVLGLVLIIAGLALAIGILKSSFY